VAFHPIKVKGSSNFFY